MASARLRDGVVVTRPNVAVCGPPGAGKSSLINSIISCVRGRICEPAVCGVANGTLTELLGAFGGRAEFPVMLWDTRGWEPSPHELPKFNYLLDVS